MGEREKRKREMKRVGGREKGVRANLTKGDECKGVCRGRREGGKRGREAVARAASPGREADVLRKREEERSAKKNEREEVGGR